VWWLGCDWFQFTVECCQSTAGLLQAISVFTASRQPTRVRLQLAAWGLWPWWCWSLCYWHECSQLLEFDHFASYIAGFDRLSALAYLHWVAGKAFVCAKYSTWGTRTVSESISYFPLATWLHSYHGVNTGIISPAISLACSAKTAIELCVHFLNNNCKLYHFNCLQCILLKMFAHKMCLVLIVV